MSYPTIPYHPKKNATATQSERIILIIGESRRAGVGYDLDNFRLSKNWKTTIHCDRSNLQYADDRGKYRFGFNGKEKDSEVKGYGNSLDFGARIYDSKTGKFLSTDPLKYKYPELSNYQFASNTPISAIDLDGLETFWVQGEARASIPIFGGSGLTGSVQVGLVFDLKGNAALFVTPSVGVQIGAGGTAGISAGFNLKARTIDDVKGWGVNLGGYFAVKKSASGEGNFAVPTDNKGKPNNINDTKLGGTLGLPNMSYGYGISLYADASYTFFIEEFSYKIDSPPYDYKIDEQFINSFFESKEVNSALDSLQEKMGVKDDALFNEQIKSKLVEQLKLSDKEGD